MFHDGATKKDNILILSKSLSFSQRTKVGHQGEAYVYDNTHLIFDTMRCQLNHLNVIYSYTDE